MKTLKITLTIALSLFFYSCQDGKDNDIIIPITPSGSYTDPVENFKITKFDDYTISYREEDGLLESIRGFAGEEIAQYFYTPLNIKTYHRSIMDRNQLDSTSITNLEWYVHGILISGCDIINGYYYYQESERIDGGYNIKATFTYNDDEQLTNVTFIGNKWEKYDGRIYEEPINEEIINIWDNGNLLSSEIIGDFEYEYTYIYSNIENKYNLFEITDVLSFSNTTPSTIGMHALVFTGYLGKGSKNLVSKYIKKYNNFNHPTNEFSIEYSFLKNGLIDYITETDSLYNDRYRYRYSYIIEE